MGRFRRSMVVAAALMLAACGPTVLGVAGSRILAPADEVNMLNASYAAADQLSMQTKQKFGKSTPLFVSRFEELVNNPKQEGSNPRLGSLMADQIESRFIQLGYNIVHDTSARGEVAGVYEIIGNRLAVRVRMKNAQNGAMLAMYDYWLPITGDMRRYMDQKDKGIPVYKVRQGMDEVFVR